MNNEHKNGFGKGELASIKARRCIIRCVLLKVLSFKQVLNKYLKKSLENNQFSLLSFVNRKFHSSICFIHIFSRKNKLLLPYRTYLKIHFFPRCLTFITIFCLHYILKNLSLGQYFPLHTFIALTSLINTTYVLILTLRREARGYISTVVILT